jgi:hypothetical protein
MSLYHGTTKRVADAAPSEGIKPRGEGAGNWPERPSRADCIYLAAGFGATYAVASSERAGEAETAECAIIEIEAPDDGNLLPDEDFLTECVLMAYQEGELPDPGDKRKHTLSASLRDSLEAYAGTDWLRVLEEQYKDQFKPIDAWIRDCCAVDESGKPRKGWEASVFGLGSCAYKGLVAPWSIRRVAYIPMSNIILQLMKAENVKPSIPDYQRNGSGLLTRNALIFGDPPRSPNDERFRHGIRVISAPRR